MNLYLELKKRHQKEVNEFPMIFAFSPKQLEEGMEKLGVKDLNEIFKMHGGMFCRRTDIKRLQELMERHVKEMADAIKEDLTGNGFIFQMFNYELSNHEYCVTGDVEETLNSLGLSFEEIEKSESMKTGLRLAISKQADY